jgi:hypothetical protein
MKSFSEFKEERLFEAYLKTRPTTIFLNYPERGKKKSYVNQTRIVDETNLAAFYKYVESNTDFLFTDGKKRKIENKRAVLYSIEKAAEHADFISKSQNLLAAKAELDTIVIETPDGELTIYDLDINEIPFTKLDDSGGGDNKYNQGLQCVISACVENGIRPTAKNFKEISKYANIGDTLIREILLSREKYWLKTSFAIHRKIISLTGRLPGHSFHEESSKISVALEDHARTLFAKQNLEFKRDRWSPADIWIVSPDFDIAKIKKTQTLQEMKEMMENMFNWKMLIGISLKKISKKAEPKVDFVNHSTHSSTAPVFLGDMETSLSAQKPFGVMHGFSWWDKEHHEYILTSTYGAKNDPDPRISGLRLQLAKPGTGAMHGAVMGETIASALKKFGSWPSYQELLGEFKKGYINKDMSFWKKYAKLWSKATGDQITAENLMEIAYRLYPYNADDKNPFGKDGHGPGCTWINVNFVNFIQSLNEDDRKNALSIVYGLATSQTETSVVFLKIY